MNKKSATLALMGVAAASLTSWLVTHDSDPTRVYVFSQKHSNLYYWNSIAPPIICVPEQNEALVVTDVVRPGVGFKKYQKEYPDAIIELTGNAEKAVTLNNPDGSWKNRQEILEQIGEKFQPKDEQNLRNVISCIKNLADKLKGSSPEPSTPQPARPDPGKLETRSNASRATLTS